MPFNQSGAHAQANIGTYNDVAGNQVNYGGSQQDVLNKLEPVEIASFKSDKHSPCLEGTRIGILNKVMEWAKDPNSQPIFWLSGIAGTGKSTISQTLCESLEKHNLLGASFFCSRDSRDLRQVGKIVPTLAYFLAQQFKDYRDQITFALEADSTLAAQGIKRQFKSLFMHPLENVNMNVNNWHVILVIDGLDECEDRDATQNMISILRDMPAQFYSCLHIFISCRPEYHIQKEFGRTPNKELFKLHDIESEIVQKDIQLYLKKVLHDISENDVACLAERAGRLFIYAFTQVQYLRKARGPVSVQSRLNELVNNNVISKSIDDLYDTILTKSLEDMEVQEKRDAKYFINIVVNLSDPLSQHALSELWKPCDVASFGSVLNIPESEEAPIHIFHASFPDYILDQRRCHSDFYCSSQMIHQELALACVKYMNRNLEFNMFNMGIEDHISSFPKGRISLCLQYSCKYWTFHLTRCSGLEYRVLTELTKFVSSCFFFWMESMSILHSIDSAIPGLISVVSWLEKYNSLGSSSLQSVIYEGQRFLQLVGSLLKEYPLQLYYSGMAWLPQSSVLHILNNTLQKVPKILHGLKSGWDMCEVTIRCESSVYSVAFSPDGKDVVSGLDCVICVWDVATGRLVCELDGHTDWVNSVAFCPDGTQVVSGSKDKTVCIWHVATGKWISKLDGHSSSVYSVEFSPDGKQLVSGSADSTVRIWDVATGRQIHKLDGHSDHVKSVAFSPNGKQVVSGSSDHTLRIWDVVTGKQIHKLEGHSSQVNSVAFSMEHVVSGSSDGTLSIWDVDTGKQIQELDGHFDVVFSVALSRDGQQVVSGSIDTLCIWDVATGNQIHKLEGHSGVIGALAFSPDGKQVVSGSEDHTICIWHVATGKQFHKRHGHYYPVHSVTFSPDGKQVVSGSADDTASIWDVATGNQIHKLDGHSGAVYSVAFSPDGTQVASGSSDKTVCIWDVATGKQIHKLDHSDPVNYTAFSPNGTQVVSVSDKIVCIRHVATGKYIHKLDGNFDSVDAVAFSPDGNRVVYRLDDMTCHSWNMINGVLSQIPEADCQLFPDLPFYGQ